MGELEPGDDMGGMWDSVISNPAPGQEIVTEGVEDVTEELQLAEFSEINNKEQREYQRLMESIRDELND